MNALERFYHVVGVLNEWVGRILLWFCYPMAFIVGYEVVSRYVLQRATIWSWDVNVQILAAMGSLGGGYALLYGSHVSVDVLVKPLPKRKKAIIDFTTDVLTVLCLGILTWYFASLAYTSVLTLERHVTFFAPPIYPLRVAIALGSLLLLLQAFCNLLKNLTLSLGWEPERAGAQSGGRP